MDKQFASLGSKRNKMCLPLNINISTNQLSRGKQCVHLALYRSSSEQCAWPLAEFESGMSWGHLAQTAPSTVGL